MALPEGLTALPPGVTPPQAGPSPSGAGEDDGKRAKEEEMRRDMMATVLDTAARERCAYLTCTICP